MTGKVLGSCQRVVDSTHVGAAPLALLRAQHLCCPWLALCYSVCGIIGLCPDSSADPTAQLGAPVQDALGAVLQLFGVELNACPVCRDVAAREHRLCLRVTSTLGRICRTFDGSSAGSLGWVGSTGLSMMGARHHFAAGVAVPGDLAPHAFPLYRGNVAAGEHRPARCPEAGCQWPSASCHRGCLPPRL